MEIPSPATRREIHGERLAVWVWSGDGLLDGSEGGRSATFVRPNASERWSEVGIDGGRGCHRQQRTTSIWNGGGCRVGVLRPGEERARVGRQRIRQVVHRVNGRLESEDGDEEREAEHRPRPRPSTVGEQQTNDEQQPEPDPNGRRAKRESVRVRVRHMAL